MHCKIECKNLNKNYSVNGCFAFGNILINCYCCKNIKKCVKLNYTCLNCDQACRKLKHKYGKCYKIHRGNKQINQCYCCLNNQTWMDVVKTTTDVVENMDVVETTTTKTYKKKLFNPFVRKKL